MTSGPPTSFSAPQPASVASSGFSFVIAVVPAYVFRSAAAMDIRVNLLFDLEDKFPDWSAAVRSAGSELELCQLRLHDDSFVVTISNLGSQFSLAKQIIEQALAALPSSAAPLCICGEDARRRLDSFSTR
jgi:hypothetical protein